MIYHGYKLPFLCLFFIWSCASSDDQLTEQTLPSKSTFPASESISNLLLMDPNFNIENGTLVILQDDAKGLHIQVSSLVFNDSNADLIRDEVKRDIVYVAFESFIKTTTEEFTITAIPLKMRDAHTVDRYMTEFQKSFKVHRKTGTKILQKHFFTSTYRTLYSYQSIHDKWLPNERFKLLQYELLPDAYRLLVKE